MNGNWPWELIWKLKYQLGVLLGLAGDKESLLNSRKSTKKRSLCLFKMYALWSGWRKH